MAKPFNLGKFINPLITEEDSQLTGGGGGSGGGGGITPTPTPTPTSTTGNSSADECSIVDQNCPKGYVCQLVSSGGGGLGFFAVPTFKAKCVPVPAPTPTPTPTPTSTGDDTGRAKIRCCGPATNNICGEVSGTSCPRGTAECDTAGTS